jgi:ATP-dependent exoDNAse (exonuclease V) beta subunit/transposase-like protein
MATPLSAAHRVPHTVKAPARCAHCGSTRLIRKGTRRKKLEIAQLWQCKLCRRVFTPSPPALRYKSYPLRLILDGVSLYNLGYSLPAAVRKLKEKHGYKIPPKTLASWMAEHRDLTTYQRLRDHPPIKLTPAQTIRSTKLYHRQVYSFAYHRPKLALMREEPRHARFASLADFLEQVPAICPHDLFTDSSRASQLANFVSRNHLIVAKKENFATRTAALVVPTVGDNRLRHETLQRFMLANDSVTVAVEIPIWLTERDIEALEIEHGISLRAEGNEPRVLTGHIDFIQVRNGAVHILDHKPDARTNKPIAQLTLYALALTRLAGLRLFDIKCAWFNEEQYCEFFPRSLLARQ